MKKHNVEPSKESSCATSENSLKTLSPKGTEFDHNGCDHIMGNGQLILGL
ncbi:MAG: hypothetical protein MPEBLZ_00959 [Candidatus Methanoperedens nitroreducens]|uniref:Uncharacterized protein n=1 Tax=Candidatus Methanoperedens nitratireducens TaxID=1392998 RepID=A0A0P8CM66_9EURY|nr:MAG: hypothetical protein MPEBLZ_00959 [Candidatus Methanoperedens sp. BLZ1]MBZ0175184.1 hypothetical protein [Candidatus Methanoperedens nitroreducens]MCX9078030.1 hypothetical protein [Candidatus Methanoperedens sp.]CAG0962472.1 hypothetical protein METP3_00923 [Methanosarcinales archaeon]